MPSPIARPAADRSGRPMPGDKSDGYHKRPSLDAGPVYPISARVSVT
ncbi:hypothetical protein SZ55_2791 [Pseudomonas sp. FeS53a]|nr:hypothetical protein SZ55_2791 [Pseudomonas sp. FeS53a]